MQTDQRNLSPESFTGNYVFLTPRKRLISTYLVEVNWRFNSLPSKQMWCQKYDIKRLLVFKRGEKITQNVKNMYHLSRNKSETIDFLIRHIFITPYIAEVCFLSRGFLCRVIFVVWKILWDLCQHKLLTGADMHFLEQMKFCSVPEVTCMCDGSKCVGLVMV